LAGRRREEGKITVGDEKRQKSTVIFGRKETRGRKNYCRE
jgi:hypothetical protein